MNLDTDGVEVVERRPLWRRLLDGITSHFLLRANDWIMTSMLLWVGAALLFDPELFHLPTFVLLAQYASADFWGLLAVGVGFVRLAALVVNGTFPSFIWSPHFRTVGALLTCFFWFQLTLALLTGLAVSPMLTAVTPHLFLFDLFNAYLAAGEAGIAERRRRNGRNST
jgi:hypothetical protein